MRKRDHGQGGLRLRGRIWWMLYRVDGKQRQESSGSESKETAERMLQERLVDTRRGAMPAQDIKGLRYEDLRESYLKTHPKQAEYPGLKHIDEFFAGKRVVNITTQTIEDFIEHRRDEDEVADPTIRRNLTVLRSMFRYAWKKNMLQLANVPYFPMPEDSEAAGQYIPPFEFEQILKALPEERGTDSATVKRLRESGLAKQHNGGLRSFFTFLYYSGCRLGAAQKITWDMVKDCEAIELPGSIMKSRRPLRIELAGPLEPIANMLKRTFQRPGLPVFDSTNYRVAWAKAVAKAGLGTWDAKTRTRTGPRIHDCRVSAAVNLLESGIEESTVLKIGGWKTRSMLDRYNVVDAKRTRAAMVQVGHHVEAKRQAQS